jgi:hypothetical protein
VLDTAHFRSTAPDVPAIVEKFTRSDSATLWLEIKNRIVQANDTVITTIFPILHAVPYTGPGFSLFLKQDTSTAYIGIQKGTWVGLTSSRKWPPATC